jgi:integrase
MTYLSPEEVVAVLKAARERAVRDWAMILLAYRHGLRASEVCGLKLADIDLKAGSISIRRLKGSLSQVQPLYQHRGQPLLDEMNALRAWLRTRPADGSDFSRARKAADFIGASSFGCFGRLRRLLGFQSRNATLTA